MQKPTAWVNSVVTTDRILVETNDLLSLGITKLIANALAEAPMGKPLGAAQVETRHVPQVCVSFRVHALGQSDGGVSQFLKEMAARKPFHLYRRPVQGAGSHEGERNKWRGPIGSAEGKKTAVAARRPSEAT